MGSIFLISLHSSFNKFHIKNDTKLTFDAPKLWNFWLFCNVGKNLCSFLEEAKLETKSDIFVS
jgi:hypothetical protein